MVGGFLPAVMSHIYEPRGSRKPVGTAQKFTEVFALTIAAYHLWMFTIGTYDIWLHRWISAGSILALCFLTYSFSKKPSTRLPSIDIFLALLMLGITAYLGINYDWLVWHRIQFTPGSLSPWEIGMAAVFILMVFELGRRVLGNVMGLIVLAGVIFTLAGPYMPGMWRHGGYSVVEMIDFTIFGISGMMGIPVGVASTYIILFMLFGGLTQMSGMGRFFNDLAMAVAGRLQGGPAKVSVIASALFGMISGSGAANVVVTGSFTIPMMKRVGFEGHFAGAVEAAASTGGLITPPIMGGVLFIMVELIGADYWSIAVVCAIPAILYFLGIFVQVHAYAVKKNIKGVDPTVKIPSLALTLKNGWHNILPLIAITGLLAYGYSPIRAALYSMVVIVIASWFRKEDRIGIKKLLKGLATGVRLTRLVMTACALAGILVGVVTFTGLGNMFVSSIIDITGGLLLPTMLVAAVASLFFGMALNIATCYLLVAIFVVPATVTLGIPLISAHLFAIYYAALHLVTPPIGPSFFQAASLADAPLYKTGFQATRLVVAGYLVPFIWIYRPGVLLMGSP
ncbi:TRAP transporter permease, partial [Chloroflexota bacterium]